jgi:hypothetical protein
LSKQREFEAARQRVEAARRRLEAARRKVDGDLTAELEERARALRHRLEEVKKLRSALEQVRRSLNVFPEGTNIEIDQLKKRFGQNLPPGFFLTTVPDGPSVPTTEGGLDQFERKLNQMVENLKERTDPNKH